MKQLFSKTGEGAGEFSGKTTEGERKISGMTGESRCGILGAELDVRAIIS